LLIKLVFYAAHACSVKLTRKERVVGDDVKGTDRGRNAAGQPLLYDRCRPGRPRVGGVIAVHYSSLQSARERERESKAAVADAELADID